MEVGDYVRTKRGNIGKIIAYKDNSVSPFDVVLDCGAENDEEYVVKSSPRIIDLIGVGDYVNNCVVVNKKDDTIQIIQLMIPLDLKEKDIKSILTREMFENMEYRIGD